MKKIKLNKKIFTVLMGGIVISGTMVGCGDKSIETQIEIGQKQIFEPGEHIIYLQIPTNRNNERLEYHDGYEIVGVSSRGRDVAKALYVNTEEVECVATKTGSGNFDYITFGTPAVLEVTETPSTYVLK